MLVGRPGVPVRLLCRASDLRERALAASVRRLRRPGVPGSGAGARLGVRLRQRGTPLLLRGLPITRSKGGLVRRGRLAGGERCLSGRRGSARRHAGSRLTLQLPASAGSVTRTWPRSAPACRLIVELQAFRLRRRHVEQHEAADHFVLLQPGDFEQGARNPSACDPARGSRERRGRRCSGAARAGKTSASTWL